MDDYNELAQETDARTFGAYFIQLLRMPTPDWRSLVGSGRSIVVLQMLPGATIGHFFSLRFPREEEHGDVHVYDDKFLNDVICASMSDFEREARATAGLTYFLPCCVCLPPARCGGARGQSEVQC